MARSTKLIIILGYNGTGKSTLVQKFIDNELKKQSRALIITPDCYEFINIPEADNLKTFKGARRLIANDNIIKEVETYRNGLLIFDDCRAYFNSKLEIELHTLLIRRRQRMVDVIAVGHGFTEVPPKFFTFANEIFLFNTKDNIHRRKDVIKDFDRMQQAQTRVNQQAIKEPHYFEIIKQ